MRKRSENNIASVSNEDLLQIMLELKQRFENKIEFDEYKNKLFDKMHKQLEEYQNDAIAASVMPIVMDLILLIDQIRKNESYMESEYSKENYMKLLALYDGVAEDLEMVLLRQDIEPYCDENDKINIRRQKVNKTVNTNDESKNNLIRESVAPGYEKFGKVIRPEKVDIYKYKANKKG